MTWRHKCIHFNIAILQNRPPTLQITKRSFVFNKFRQKGTLYHISQTVKLITVLQFSRLYHPFTRQCYIASSGAKLIREIHVYNVVENVDIKFSVHGAFLE